MSNYKKMAELSSEIAMNLNEHRCSLRDTNDMLDDIQKNDTIKVTFADMKAKLNRFHILLLNNEKTLTNRTYFKKAYEDINNSLNDAKKHLDNTNSMFSLLITINRLISRCETLARVLDKEAEYEKKKEQ